jgi:hypothetical protein
MLESPFFQPTSVSISPKHERNCVFMGISDDSCPPCQNDVLRFENGMEGYVSKKYKADDVQMYEVFCRDTDTIGALGEAVRQHINSKTPAEVRFSTVAEGSTSPE